VPITTKVASSNPANGEVYSIQYYVIKFVSDLWQVGGFLRILQFPHQYNWPSRYNWNIVESGIKHHNQTLTSKCMTIWTKWQFMYRHIVNYLLNVIPSRILHQYSCN